MFLLSFVTADDLVSELTYKFDVLRRFINIEETNHSKGSSGNKGGSRSKSLINPHPPLQVRALPRTLAITPPAATEAIPSSPCRPCLSTTQA